MSKLKAAIFDLDGTLLDSMYVWARVDELFLEKRGLTAPDFYGVECSKRSFYQLAIYTIELFGLDETPEEVMAEWMMLAEEEYRRNVRLKPHAAEAVDKALALGLKTAVCTSLLKELYTPALINNGLADKFSTIVSADKESHGKSDSRIYIHTAELLGVRPDECIFFDDVSASLQAAKTAGMKTVGVIEPLSSQDINDMRKHSDILVEELSVDIFDKFI
ncbi:MAG: HAD family phosphatase [Eubacterium sp.]|nr:HAD family phosphatase [Eubacterium sp.]